jgi:hypothetical protein
VVLPECKAEGVQYVFSRLNELEVEVGEAKLPVPYAAGWADFIRGETPLELLTRADAVLYANKRAPADPVSASTATKKDTSPPSPHFPKD